MLICILPPGIWGQKGRPPALICIRDFGQSVHPSPCPPTICTQHSLPQHYRGPRNGLATSPPPPYPSPPLEAHLPPPSPSYTLPQAHWYSCVWNVICLPDPSAAVHTRRSLCLECSFLIHQFGWLPHFFISLLTCPLIIREAFPQPLAPCAPW